MGILIVVQGALLAQCSRYQARQDQGWDPGLLHAKPVSQPTELFLQPCHIDLIYPQNAFYEYLFFFFFLGGIPGAVRDLTSLSQFCTQKPFQAGLEDYTGC